MKHWKWKTYNLHEARHASYGNARPSFFWQQKPPPGHNLQYFIDISFNISYCPPRYSCIIVFAPLETPRLNIRNIWTNHFLYPSHNCTWSDLRDAQKGEIVLWSMHTLQPLRREASRKPRWIHEKKTPKILISIFFAIWRYKHCQRHNGPRGWIILLSYLNQQFKVQL